MTGVVSPSTGSAAPRGAGRERGGGWWRVGRSSASSVAATGALAGIIAGGALLRFWDLTHQSLWYDEAVTRFLLTGTPRQLLAALPRTESTPPLYYLVAWGWTHVLGDTALGLRSLSAVAGTGVVGVAFAAGRALAGVRVGLVAAVLAAVNPLLVWYSQEARSYALMTLVTATSLWLFARVRARPSRGRLAAWTLVCALALMTHYFAVFVIGAEAALVLADRRMAAGARGRPADLGQLERPAGPRAGLDRSRAARLPRRPTRPRAESRAARARDATARRRARADGRSDDGPRAAPARARGDARRAHRRLRRLRRRVQLDLPPAGRCRRAPDQGGTAGRLMATLAKRPDAVLVAAETVKDFQLRPGDLLRLRLQNGRTKQLTTVPFHYAGVANEFPTAPTDSFLVASASYVARRTGSDAVGTFLVQTDGTPPAQVAARVRRAVGTTAKVTDLQTSRRVVGSNLTAVELSGLTKIELGFALVLAAAAGGLTLGLGLQERRRTFAIAAALGARRTQLGAFVWSESAFVTGAGLVLGALIAAVLSEMLVKILTGVFDPPPDALAVPWVYLLAVAALVVGTVLTAGALVLRASRRPPIEVLRDA